MSDQKLQVIPLGGLGEFGMNMTAIRYGDDIIVVDAGMMFPDAELLGVDLVMPDLTFLKENQAHVRALILTPGYTESERAVRPRMEEIFSRSERRIIVSCFSSSIHRIQLVLDLAQEYGRRVAVVGRSMVSVTEIAHSLGLLSIPDGILLRPQDAMEVAPKKVAFLISGTQGEPMSA